MAKISWLPRAGSVTTVIKLPAVKQNHLSRVFDVMNHFLPPGVACTTGLSHNPFTWRTL